MSFPIKDTFKSLKDLNSVEWKWVFKHLFKAYGVFKISKLAREIANEHIQDPDFDGDYAGGQVDAFRHTLWMALLTQKYGEKFAREVGYMYEESNKLDFKKGKLEDYQLPDSASMMMDLLNNEVGIEIGKKYPKAALSSLIDIVKRYVLEGKCWKIKKDAEKNFLDINGNVIKKELWLGKWNTPKVIVPTNFDPNYGKKHD